MIDTIGSKLDLLQGTLDLMVLQSLEATSLYLCSSLAKWVSRRCL